MKKILPIAMAIILIAGACNKSFEESNMNPNKPLQSSPSLILNGIELDIFYLGSHYRGMTNIMVASQYMLSSDDFYGNNSYNWGATDNWGTTSSTITGSYFYLTLNNVNQMIQEAERTGDQAYIVLAKTLKAYLFLELTRQVGDIPCSEALSGDDGIYEPVYDTQKQVYMQCLNWLEEANTEYAGLTTGIEKDLVYNGKIDQWWKFNNVLRLRILIDLSHYADDTELNVKQRFADIINHPAENPVFGDISDNARFTYLENMNNKYPFYQERDEPRAQVYYMSSTFIDPMIRTNDPRLFVIAEPTDSAKNSGNPNYANMVSSFRGIKFGIATIDVAAIVRNNDVNKKQGSRMHARYESYTGEPYVILGYPEMNFCIAEAINRGWIPGDASAYYEKGIAASMNFYGIDAGDISQFLQQPAIQYAGDNQSGLSQILAQKYTAFFNNSRYEGFYSQRRTGIPVFTTGPGSFNDGKVPKRWTYPRQEYDNNLDNLNEALKRQYGGADDRNDLMWVLK